MHVSFIFKILFLMLSAVSCSKSMTADSVQRQPADENVCLHCRSAIPDHKEDFISQTVFFFYNTDGLLVHKAYGGSDGTCKTKVPLGEYTCKVCCGDVPSSATTMEEYCSYMPSLQYNCYDPQHTGFSMYGEVLLNATEGTAIHKEILLTRNFCKVVVASVEPGDFKNESPGRLTGLKVEKVVLADIPGRAHMEGNPDNSGSSLINRLESGSIIFCTGSQEQCTVGKVGDELFCMSGDNGKIVIQTLASFDVGDDKTWYYSIPLSVRANHSYTYNVTVKGPGSDVPDGPMPDLVSFTLSCTEAGDGDNIQIDF